MIRFLGTLAVAISLAGGAAFAQVQEFEGYWQSLSQAVKANNFQGVRRLVEQDRRSAERAFFQAADHYVSLGLKGDIEGEKHRLDILRNLGNAFVSIDNNDDYSKYTQFLQRLNLIKKDQWSSTYGDYVDFILAYAGVSAQEKGKRSEDDAKAALELAEDPIRGWEDLGDFYLQGQALRSKALLQAWAGDLDGSKRSLELARACFETFGSSAGVDLINRSLTEVAVELANKEKEDRRVEAEEDAKGVEQPGEKPWTDIQMAYRKDARGLGPLVHPYSVDEYLLWNRVLLIKDEPKNFSDEYERSPGRFSAYYTETFGRGPSANSLLYPLTFQQVDNRLTLDLNSDGRVQGPERLKATSSPKVFEFEDLPAKSGGTFDYAVELVDIGQETWFGQANSVFANEGDKAVAFRRSCHMEGSLEGRDLILVDDNSNGAYNDLGGDVLYVKGDEPSFFGKMMHLAGEIYEVRIPDALGNVVKVRKYEGETGSVAVEWGAKEEPAYLSIRGVDGDVFNAIFRLEDRGAVDVPVGKYEFYFGYIVSGRGRAIQSVEIHGGKSDSFDVDAGEKHVLKLGEPYTIEFEVKENPENYVLRGRDIEYYGVSGERYLRFYRQPPLPKIILKRKDGGIVAKESMRRIEFEDRLRDPDSVWFAKDLELEKRKIGADAEFEMKLTESHKLLGPIRTDFIEEK